MIISPKIPIIVLLFTFISLSFRKSFLFSRKDKDSSLFWCIGKIKFLFINPIIPHNCAKVNREPEFHFASKQPYQIRELLCIKAGAPRDSPTGCFFMLLKSIIETKMIGRGGAIFAKQICYWAKRSLIASSRKTNAYSKMNKQPVILSEGNARSADRSRSFTERRAR